ncbi:MAG: hypothetical protein WDN48_17515 [Pseudolabrys sp.]
MAELARLIGQNDPFAEFGRDGARRAPPAEHPALDWGGQQSGDGYTAPQAPQPLPPDPHPPAPAAKDYYEPGPAAPVYGARPSVSHRWRRATSFITSRPKRRLCGSGARRLRQ